jgi:competence protein ComEA
VNLHSLTLGQRRLLVAAVVAVALAVVGAPRLLHRGTAAPVPAPLRVAAAPARSARAGAAALVVDVAGAVRRPGLYRLPRSSRVADAIALAGGFVRRADRVSVNLAAPVADGEEIVVPARGAGTAGASSGAGPSPTGPLDLNTATLEQLDGLPGIGPTTAQKILDYRQAHGPFRSVADLDAVPGIGQGRIEQLKGLVIP